MSPAEHIARIIARKLGHNDDTGMYWERYVLAAEGILQECWVIIPGAVSLAQRTEGP